MNNSTQLILGMFLGFEKDHEIYEGVNWDVDMAGELLKGKKITKEDVFSLTTNGKSFFEYKKTWENIESLFTLLEENGGGASIDDLNALVKEGKTAIELATECKALKELFIPEIWVGHSTEMEAVWYSIPKNNRIGVRFLEIKSVLAKLEGRETREEKLKEMGVDSIAMRMAIRDGKLDAIKALLEKNGDHFKLDDARLCDEDGDHALYTKAGWDLFENLYNEWEAHGEIPDVDFFLFKRGTRLSIVEQAFNHSAEKKVFNSNVFAGRPDEMMELYNNLSEENQKKIDVTEVFSEIIEGMSSDKVRIDGGVSLESLTDALYSFEGDMDASSPIIGLGLKKIWDNADQVRENLKQKDQAMTLETLRLPSGFNGESCLVRAARFERFEKVMDVLADSKQTLSLNDLLDKNEDGESLFDLLVKSNQIETLLRPEQWDGRVSDLCALWNKIPAESQEKLKDSFRAVQTQVNILSLRSLAEKQTRSFLPALT